MRKMTHGLAGTRPHSQLLAAPVLPASLNGNARHLTQIPYRHTTGILQAHLLRHRQKWLPPIFLSGCFYKLSLPELQAGRGLQRKEKKDSISFLPAFSPFFPLFQNAAFSLSQCWFWLEATAQALNIYSITFKNVAI